MQRAIVSLAHAFNWASFHTRFSWRSERGYPDLTLWHPTARKLVFAEIKRQGGRLSAAQKECLDSLTAAGQDVYVWKPADWPAIVDVLSFGRAKAVTP